jgi:hypothetical protein
VKYKVVQIWPGLICVYVCTNQSQSYLNHLVLSPLRGSSSTDINILEQTEVQDDREEIRTVNVYLEQERAASSWY